jgi:transposase InsO family protein
MQAKETLAAYRDMTRTAERRPELAVLTDQSSEYKASFTAAIAADGLQYWHLYGPHKAAMAERVIKTLREALALHFTSRQTYRWVDALAGIVDTYNFKRVHSAHGMTPFEASQRGRPERDLWSRMYAEPVRREWPVKFAIGDWVRPVRWSPR